MIMTREEWNKIAFDIAPAMKSIRQRISQSRIDMLGMVVYENGEMTATYRDSATERFWSIVVKPTGEATIQEQFRDYGSIS